MKLNFTIILIFISILAFGQADEYQNINSLYKGGKLQETLDKSTIELSRLSPSDTIYTKLLELRAITFMDLSNFPSAIRDYQSLINLHPHICDYYSNIFYAYWELGQDSIGYLFLQKGNKINPTDLLILNNMSYYLGQVKKYEESIKYASIGLQQKNISDNMHSYLLNNRGYALICINKFEQGLEDINKSIAFNPDNSFSYCYRAMANIGLRQMTTVCSDLEKSKNLGAVKLTQFLRSQYCEK